MGWQDESTLVVKGKPQPVPSSGAPAPAPAPAATTSDGGWQSESTPITKQAGGIPVTQDKSTSKGYDDTSWSGLAGDTAYRAANTGTLGLLDYGLAGLHKIERGTGYDPNATDLTQIQKENEEWGANHPYLGLGADIAGYTLGAGKLGIGGKIATKLGGSLLARVAGAGLENVGTGLVSDELKSQGQATVGELLKDAAISGTVGAVSGAVPGGRGALAGDNPTGGLKTVTENAFKPLETTHYDPSGVANDFDAVKSSLAAKQTGSIGDKLNNQIDKISASIAAKQKAGQSVTADDITNFQIDINKAARGGRDIGIAQAYDKALDGTMANTRPLFTTLSGPAEISAASDAARAAANRSKTSSEIDKWITKAGTDPSGTQADITKRLDSQPQFYTNVMDPLRDAAQGPGTVGKLLTAAAHPALDAAIGAGTGYMFGGQDIGSAMLEGAASGVAGAGARHMLSQARTNSLVNKLAKARYMNANPGATANLADFRQGNRVMSPLSIYAPQAGVGVGASNLFDDLSQRQQQ